ncbi:hypothetical protein MM239_20150 [Belliella sp. DSM 111904]|uniref:Uncharacterized protein n=1 Tax=Belliella filtrata TaxID=2923435 RepID=A0ABS9V5L1_9BACT|nr:hypothetical protein [Belliella filtrata]MCH7411710.1 hypothetical protein [Belliella filtrata]
MKILLNNFLILLTLLGVSWSLVSFAQQNGIDDKYNFSGSYNRIRGTESCLFTAHQTGNKVVGRMNFFDPRIQGTYSGTITKGVIEATVTWEVAPDHLKNVKLLRLQKFTGRDYPELALFDNPNYKTNNRVRPKLVYALEKKATTNTSSAHVAATAKKSNETVKIRVDYKFIYLPSTADWPKEFLSELKVYRPDLALYGTGSIRADRETASGTTEIKSIGNLPNRVFDIPKGRATTKSVRFYYDSKKNLAWGKNKRFYNFSKDAELPATYQHTDKQLVEVSKKGVGVNPSAVKEINNFTPEHIIKVDFKREFIVNRAALEGKTERVLISAHSHLSHKLPVRDIVFGNQHRKVYLHELGVINKLNNKEKFQNDIHDANNKRIGVSLDPPIYYFTDVDNGPMIAFTIEVIDEN